MGFCDDVSSRLCRARKTDIRCPLITHHQADPLSLFTLGRDPINLRNLIKKPQPLCGKQLELTIAVMFSQQALLNFSLK